MHTGPLGIYSVDDSFGSLSWGGIHQNVQRHVYNFLSYVRIVAGWLPIVIALDATQR